MPNKTFTRELEPAEVQAEGNAYLEDQMRIKALDAELSQVTTKIKGQIATIKKRNDARLDTIASRSRQVNEIVYGIRDVNGNTMNFYDKTGKLVESRGMMPDEYQARIFTQKDGNIELEFPDGDKSQDEEEPEEEVEEQEEEETEEEDEEEYTDEGAADADDQEEEEEGEGIGTVSEVINELDKQEEEQFMDDVPDYQAAQKRVDNERLQELEEKKGKKKGRRKKNEESKD